MSGLYSSSRARWWLAALLLVAAVVGPWALPAGAHSFLVSTSPSQGERLDAAPEAIVLEFSEAVDLRSVRVELQAQSGRLERALEPVLAKDGLAVRATVRDLDDGVYVVAWQALSVVDGHGSSGEFAFSVSDEAGALPAPDYAEPVDRPRLASAWLFSGGLAAALGAAVLSAVMADAGGVDLTRRVGRPGLLVALVGVGLAGAASDGFKLVVFLIVAELLLVALALIGLRRRGYWSAAPVVAAAAVWATRSHGASDGVIGWIVDFTHLIAGTAWLGSLVLVVVIGWRRRRQGCDWLPVVRRYARPALWFVLILGAAGTLGAIRLVPSWSQLSSTGYGRVLAAKVALFAIAAVAAAGARWRGLNHDRPALTRRAMTGETAVVIGAALLAGVLSAGAPPLPAGAADQLLGPPPLGTDVVRDAGLAGQLNVEVASDGRRLDVSVFGPSGPLVGTEVDVTVRSPAGDTNDLLPRPCGTGCFTQALDLAEGRTKITVTASSPDLTGGYFEGTLQWPPGERRPERLKELVERMRQVPELTLTETVDSGPGSLVSPATFTLDGDGFVDSEPYAAANLEQVWLWAGPTVRLILYVPGSQIFAEMELDDSGRIATERLVTPGHLITREFDYPD